MPFLARMSWCEPGPAITPPLASADFSLIDGASFGTLRGRVLPVGGLAEKIVACLALIVLIGGIITWSQKGGWQFYGLFVAWFPTLSFLGALAVWQWREAGP